MTHRVGTFLLMLGLLLIALFVLSDLADAPSCNLLAVGGILFVLGVILWFRDPVKPGPPAQRFRLLRSIGKKPNKK